MAAITRAKEVNDSASVTDGGERDYTREFQVETDEPASSAEVELLAQSESSLPNRLSLHPNNINARALSISVKRNDNSHQVFSYEVKYSTKRDGQDPQENPLDDNHQVNWSSTEVDEAYFVDENGDKVVNSIGQQFEELPKRFGTEWEVSVVVNQSSYDISDASNLVNTVNTSTFSISDGTTTWGIAAGTGLLVEYAPGEIQERNGTTYYAVRYRWKLNPDGWNDSEKFLDMGTYELDSQNDTWVPVQDDDGNDITERFALNGDGNRQPFGTPAEELQFKAYAESDHSTLPVS